MVGSGVKGSGGKKATPAPATTPTGAAYDGHKSLVARPPSYTESSLPLSELTEHSKYLDVFPVYKSHYLAIRRPRYGSKRVLAFSSLP